MSFLNPSSRAEASDSLAILTGAGTALAGLIYAAKVVEVYAGGAMATWLDNAQLAGGIAVLAVFLPLFYYLKTRFGGTAVNPWKGDDFFGAVLRRAAMTAFCAVMLGMIVLTTLDMLLLSRVSAETLVDGLIAFALFVFSVSFFVLGRSPGDGGAAE
jgi:hypothetical protein